MKMNKLMWMAAGAAVLIGMAGCGEEPQTAKPSPKKTDTAAWKGAPGDPFVATGWTQGDQTSWQKQIRQRNQLQNEYTRVQ